ncbi:MAG: hypothetical protein GY696_33260, partial [Gammaproteobacteria bacterium]|nr:hypothetical protein [Gammaproteobacteria bacterium]
DDLVYTKPLLSTDDFVLVQQDVDKICAAFAQLGLTLNAGKTKQIIFSVRPDLANVPNSPIQINGSAIEEVDSYKYLGVWIDPQLSFLDHARKTVMQRTSGFDRVEAALAPSS